MEIALDPAMPIYSGGLGMLAGDTVRSAADLKVPMVAVTLLYRKGYFDQKLDASGWQTESPVEWDVAKYCRELSPRVQVRIEGRTVHARAGFTGTDSTMMMCKRFNGCASSPRTLRSRQVTTDFRWIMSPAFLAAVTFLRCTKSSAAPAS